MDEIVTERPEAAPAAVADTAAAPSAWANSKRFIKRLGPAGPLAVLAATFPPLGGFVLMGLSSRIAPWLQAHSSAGVWVYLIGAAALTALAMLPTYACAFLGGWTFGFAVGLPVAMAAFCAGALIAYMICARAAGDRVILMLAEHPRWDAVRVALLASGFWKSFWIMTLLRLPPQSPFAATNFVLATSRAPLGAYMLATVAGLLPRTALAVWAAASAATLDFADSKRIWSYSIGLVVTIVIIAVIGRMARSAIARVTAPGFPVGTTFSDFKAPQMGSTAPQTGLAAPQTGITAETPSAQRSIGERQ